MDAGLVSTGCDPLRGLVAEAFSQVPREVADFAYRRCRFVLVRGSDRGAFFLAKDLHGYHVIVFPESLLSMAKKKEAVFNVLHEVAHAYCRHKSPRLAPSVDYQKQEDEADRMVFQWSGTQHPEI